MESLLDVCQQLKELGCTLGPFRQDDETPLYEIFREVVDSGCQFPFECSSRLEFHRQFLGSQSRVYVCRSSENEVVGSFYIRANFTGRASHIANAAYMVKGTYRGRGIGTLLVKASLHLARDMNFLGMQFNMVLSQNWIAIQLYEKLGFHRVGTIPEAIRNPDGSYQDGYIMYRKLEDVFKIADSLTSYLGDVPWTIAK